VHGEELWRSDGTTTEMIMDIHSDGDSDPREIMPFGDKIVFSAKDADHGTEVWVIDNGAPTMLSDINPSGSSSPGNYTILGDHVYFQALGQDGSELYRTDGSTVELVKDIRTGTDSSIPQGLVAHGDKIFFSADDGQSGRELWWTNGSSTELLEDMNLSGDSNPVSLTSLGDKLFFNAGDSNTNRELWWTNGSQTEIVLEINPTGESNPSNLFVHQSMLFFSADDGQSGRELWRLDPLQVSNSLEKPDQSPSISIYPNPARDRLRIELESSPVSVSIFDLSGRELGFSASQEGNSLSVDLREFSKGVYLMLLLTDKGQHSNVFTVL